MAILLRASTGHDFSLYKKTTVYRRIERRMGVHQIDGSPDYVALSCKENPQEVDLLFKELLIGVTSFFRDPRHVDHPGGSRAAARGSRTGRQARAAGLGARLLHRRGGLFPGHRLQGGAGAAAGQPRTVSLQIFATDLDRDAIDKARQGFYPGQHRGGRVRGAPATGSSSKEQSGYRVRKEIREMVVFAPQNMIMDPPFTKLDILICRNLLIYLAPELQKSSCRCSTTA